MDIEAAKFRVMLDELFHNMPIGRDAIVLDDYIRDKITELSALVYVDGKQSVIDARKIIAVEHDPE